MNIALRMGADSIAPLNAAVGPHVKGRTLFIPG